MKLSHKKVQTGLAADLANASYEVLISTMKTSVVLIFEMPEEPGERGMSIITSVSVVPNEFARRYTERASNIHRGLIDEFRTEYTAQQRETQGG